MINLLSVLTTYAPVKVIKGSRIAKEESKQLATPRESTIETVIDTLSLKCGELTIEDLLLQTRLSIAALRNCLLYLKSKGKIIMRPVRPYGTGFIYKYSVVRGYS